VDDTDDEEGAGDGEGRPDGDDRAERGDPDDYGEHHTEYRGADDRPGGPDETNAGMQPGHR
jgi:hypothetical protein